MGITKWIDNRVNQIIGTVPLEDFNSLPVENKAPVVETHPTATKETDTEEKVVTTRRISLSSEEKMFVEHSIFSAPPYTTRNEILDLILDGISSISGVNREKSTIKYYIYDSVERKKPENRPYRLVFGLKRYSINFKKQAIQEAIKLGQRETQLKFALPYATLAGWLDKPYLNSVLQKQDELDAKLLKEDQKQAATTKSSSAPTQTVENILQQNTTTVAPKAPQSSPINQDAVEVLDALIQMQSNNKDLADKVKTHITALSKAKKQLIADFEVKEQSCTQLITMGTATEANIEAALNILIKIETADQNGKKAREATITNLDRTSAKLRKEGGTQKLHQEQMQRDLQEVVRNIPKVR